MHHLTAIQTFARPLSNRLLRWWRLSTQPPSLPWGTAPALRIPRFVLESPVAMRYWRLLRAFDWSCFPERDLKTPRFQPPVPYASFAAACLIKLDQGFIYMPQLRDYLIEHPELIWLLGFNRVSDNPEATLPTARHFTRMLRQMPNSCLQFLLEETVRLLRDELHDIAPDFGSVISLDTKHILAWVKENNPKAYVDDRFDKDKQPKGDPDCKLGCKKRRNQQTSPEPPKTPTKEGKPAETVAVGQFYWGYASGVVVTKVPDWGEFVLAELTQPFNQPDVSYFEPLMADTTRRLNHPAQYGTFDAAFDAFYVYAYFHPESGNWRDGFAAVPLSKPAMPTKTFDADGHPHCEAGLTMLLKYTFMSRTTRVEHERGHYVCPIAQQDQATCPVDHKRWTKGGCTHRIPTSVGARLRHQIDRDSDLYKNIYKQRTATERINAQAVALHIERPRLRNQQAISNLNTLIYVLINLRAWHRIRNKKATAAAS